MITTDEMKYDGLTKQEILDLPTIHEGHFDDLKREDADLIEGEETRTRVWVSRMEATPDGLPQVTVEQLTEAGWGVVEFF
jgi:hypothetical protein